MRFTEYLIEAPGQQVDWLKRQQKADAQRARRGRQNRAADNKQALAQAAPQHGGPQPAAPEETHWFDKSNQPAQPKAEPMDQRQAGQMGSLDFPSGQPPKDNDSPVGPLRPNATTPDTLEFLPSGIIAAAKASRQKAVEFMTLLGAMYQAKRRQPTVAMSVPLMVSQSANKEEMMSLFNAAKSQDLPHLAKMSEEIKKNAATPGADSANAKPNVVHGGAAGQEQPAAQPVPGETPAQAKVRQNLTGKIQQATRQLPQASLKMLRDLLSKGVKKSKPNPMQANNQQKPVVTSG